MAIPKTCKEWKNKVVRVDVDMVTNGGLVFHEGELLVVKSKDKHGKFVLGRYQGCINIVGGDQELLSCVTVVGDVEGVFRLPKNRN